MLLPFSDNIPKQVSLTVILEERYGFEQFSMYFPSHYTCFSHKYYTGELTPWSKDLLEKLMVTQLVKSHL
jgi:hypothetical protein